MFSASWGTSAGSMAAQITNAQNRTKGKGKPYLHNVSILIFSHEYSILVLLSVKGAGGKPNVQ